MKFHRLLLVSLAVLAAACTESSTSVSLQQSPDDLVAGEDRRRTIAFLRRMPNGLAQAHLAKTLVYLVALVLATVWVVLVLYRREFYSKALSILE